MDITTTSTIDGAFEFCRNMLPKVSRTFALNIPVLPQPLDLVVTVAYLLCRIADTVEDEGVGVRSELFAELGELSALPADWQTRADAFVTRTQRILRPQTPEPEARLV